MRVAIVIPTHEEAPNLPRLAERLLGLPLGGELIVVDHASPDGTGEVAAAAALALGQRAGPRRAGARDPRRNVEFPLLTAGNPRVAPPRRADLEGLLLPDRDALDRGALEALEGARGTHHVPRPTRRIVQGFRRRDRADPRRRPAAEMEEARGARGGPSSVRAGGTLRAHLAPMSELLSRRSKEYHDARGTPRRAVKTARARGGEEER